MVPEFENSHPHHDHARQPKPKNILYWILGIGSLVWLIIRSGFNPRRLAYPCQRAALATSLSFGAYVASLTGVSLLMRRFNRQKALKWTTLIGVCLLGVFFLGGSALPLQPAHAVVSLTLPAWRSPEAISDVFVVKSATASTDGIDNLVMMMEEQGSHFYKTATDTDGLIGSNDVVVIKVNNQWVEDVEDPERGYTPEQKQIHGRLSTNSDVLYQLINKIVHHPDVFTGEVIVAENTQGTRFLGEPFSANAEDRTYTYARVVESFDPLSYTVSLMDWTAFASDTVNGGSITASDPAGEFAQGDDANRYILLDDPAVKGRNEYSYPKFTSAAGNRVSMRYGVWNGSNYDSSRLKFINMPILKAHGMAGATIAWKNLIGFVTISNEGSRFGSWNAMHGYFWGYMGLGAKTYGLLGREMALIRAPDLNIVDAIWVAYESNTGGPADRQDTILASTDPFAVDWYASEYILSPIANNSDNVSAARKGTFRSATRVNQNAARSTWPGGAAAYPYIDLFDDYDPTGSGAANTIERNQFNAYLWQTNGDFTLRSDADTPIPFSAANFDENYPGGTLASIWITSLPDKGNLALNGSAVSRGQEIARANLGGLVYTPPSGWLGSTSFEWEAVTNTTTAYANLVIGQPGQAVSPRSSNDTNQLTFEWLPQTVDVSKYWVQIQRLSGSRYVTVYNAKLPSAVCSGTSNGNCQVKPFGTRRTAAGTYQWRIQGINRSNTLLGWSAYTAFPVPPLPAAPSGGLTYAGGNLQTDTSTFTWNEISGVDSYDFYVRSGRTTLYNTLTLDPPTPVSSTACSGGVCSFSLPSGNTLPNGTYRWWIRSNSTRTGTGPWSKAIPFSLGPAAPVNPLITNMAVPPEADSNLPTFQWQDDNTSSRDALDYFLTVEKQHPVNGRWLRYITARKIGAGVDPFCNQTSQVCTLPYTRAWPGGHYRWWVQGRASSYLGNGLGAQSVVSEFWLPGAPPAPVVTSPSGATQKPGLLTFTWAPAFKADSYNLTVYSPSRAKLYSNQNDGGLPLPASGMCTSTSCSFDVPLTSTINTYGAYTWSVQGLRDAWKGPWSTPKAFSYGPMAVSTLNTIVTNLRPDFTWSKTDLETDKFYLVVDKRNPTTGVWKDGTVKRWLTLAQANCPDTATTCSLSYVTARAWAAGTYRWHIQPFAYRSGTSGSGGLGPPADSAEFTIP